MRRLLVIPTILAVALFMAPSHLALAQIQAVIRFGPPAKYVDLSSPSFEVDVWVKGVYTTDPCEPWSQTEACGLGAYEFEVHFDPTVIEYVSVENGPFLTSTGRLIWICFNPGGHDPLNGVMTYSCTTTSNPPAGWTPFGPEGNGHLATITFAPLAVDTSPLQFQEAILADTFGTEIPHTPEVGSVTVGNYGTADSDGDGCADIEEAGDDPSLGGDRNPYDPWDFYDVTVPAKADEPPGGDPDECYGQSICQANGPRNQAVALTDVLAVLFYVAARSTGACGDNPNGNGVDYDCDKGVDTDGDTVADIPPDGVADGQGYDRTPSWPFSAAPNGAINLQDVLAALYQAGHSCVAPP